MIFAGCGTEFEEHNTEFLTIGVSHDIMHLWHA